MKKLLALIAILVIGSGGVVLATDNDKENICHATSSETNPYEAISVADNNNTHDGHVNDFPYNGPTKDNGQPTKDGDQWCEDNAPKPPEEEQPPKEEEPPVEPETPSVGKPTPIGDKVESNPVVPITQQVGK